MVLLVSIVVSAGCAGEDEGPRTLMQALGFGDPDDPASVHEARAQWTQRTEELIVACMAEHGFDYEAWSVAPDPRVDDGLTADEYRERHGYGMMSSLEASLREEEGWGDPNEQMLSDLDEPTQLAWQTALYGEDVLDPEARDGCRAEAEDEVNAYRRTDAWAELEPRLEELEARIAADARTVEAEANWTACMAAAGYPIADRDEVIAYIDEAVFDAWELEPHPETGHTSNHRWSIHPWFLETDTWAELVEMELDIAAHADACMEDPAIRAEYEQRFLEDNAELLERLQLQM